MISLTSRFSETSAIFVVDLLFPDLPRSRSIYERREFLEIRIVLVLLSLLTMAIVPTYPITGIKVGLDHGDRVPLRQEIDAWFDSIKLTDKMQVQLFILALKHFQEMDPVVKLSYFQVAGC